MNINIAVAVSLFYLFTDIHGMAFQNNQTKVKPQSMTPRFDAVSIKPCSANNSTGSRVTPTRFSWECTTVENLIRTAFLANGTLPHEGESLLKGAPSWVSSSRFTIEAVTEKPIINEDTKGLLVQDVLRRRFKLKVREDNQILKVYELIQAPGGAKIRTSKESSCFQLAAGQPPPRNSSGKPVTVICGGFHRSLLGEIDVTGITMSGFCKSMSYALERDVIDKTGLQSVYDFHLETTLDALSPYRYRQAQTSTPQDGEDGPSGSLFTAVKKLGLRLVPGTKPAKVVIIDHVEKPDAN